MLVGLAYVVFIDRPTNPGDPTAISSVVFGQYDGQRWDTEIVAEDGFAQRFFHNVKIAQFPLSLVVGWVQRTSSPELSLVISERKVTGWTESHVSGAVDINANWDLTRVGGALALVYFHRPTKELRYAKFDNGLWVTEAILTIEGDMSLTGLSLTDVDGLPGISYQLSFPNDALPGDQRYVTKNVDGVWDQSNVERPIVSSGFVNNATSIHHLTLPTIAYHIRRPDKMNFAMLIEDKEYDVFLWVIEEVGTNMAMPSHKHIGSVAYIAAYGTKAQSLLIAERV